MSYFNYHAKIKKLIKEKVIVSYNFVENYKNISPALLFYDFNDSVYVVRDYRFEEYLPLIEKYNIKKRTN